MSNTKYHIKIHTPLDWRGSKRYIRVIIYDTVEEMRKAANAYHSDIDADCLALYSPPRYRERVGKDGKWIDISDKHYGGLIRLNRQHLNLEIITHEACHAAIAIYRRDFYKSVCLGKECGPNEEILCYIMGRIAEPLLTLFNLKGENND